jgi:hypothetical protein
MKFKMAATTGLSWRRFLNIFPIGSYVKTMSADGGHLGWRSGSQDIILKVDHLSTIHAMFAPPSADIVLTLDPMRKKCFKISSETSKPI